MNISWFVREVIQEVIKSNIKIKCSTCSNNNHEFTMCGKCIKYSKYSPNAQVVSVIEENLKDSIEVLNEMIEEYK